MLKYFAENSKLGSKPAMAWLDIKRAQQHATRPWDEHSQSLCMKIFHNNGIKNMCEI